MKRFNPAYCLILLGALLGLISVAWSAVDETGFYVGLKKASPEQIHQVLSNTEGKAVFLEFKSKFCLACKKMDPILETLLPQYPQVETRIYDIVKDKAAYFEVFRLFQPNVVPIQVYIDSQGVIQKVYYDYHNRPELTEALNLIDPAHVGTVSHFQSSSEPVGIEYRFNQALASGSLLTILLAFSAGVMTSFFPCTLAMLPILMGYMGAYGESDKKAVFAQVALFVFGLASIMTVMGITLSYLGKTFGELNSSLLYYVIGSICILMALQTLELIHIPLPKGLSQLPETNRGKILTPYLLGCSFGLVASPCGTPVLAAILGVISQKGDLVLGGLSLFAYALGQGVLMLVVGLFTGLLKHRSTLMKVGTVFTKISGAIFILVGIGFLLQGAGLWTNLLVKLNLGG